LAQSIAKHYHWLDKWSSARRGPCRSHVHRSYDHAK